MNRTTDIMIEKYRPSNLNEIIGQNVIVNRLKGYVNDGNMPHLMLAGPAGVGKTSSAICLAKELYGAGWRMNFKELNASDSRGIDVVRNTIKEYASLQSLGDVEFKIVFLDEADNLTKDAQAALRRTMERFTASCRFILSCNYSSKIIEPIQSRCAVYRFKRISNQDIINKCKDICYKESIKISNEALDAIAYVSEGDLRKAIGLLDSSYISNTKNDYIHVSDIYEISNIVHPHIIKDIVTKALKGEFFGALVIVEKLWLDGLVVSDIMKGMMNEVMDMNIEDRMKVDIVERIGETDFRINEGANELIQMKWLIASIAKIGS